MLATWETLHNHIHMALFLHSFCLSLSSRPAYHPPESSEGILDFFLTVTEVWPLAPPIPRRLWSNRGNDRLTFRNVLKYITDV